MIYYCTILMLFRKIEPVFDMREVSQHPSGARYMHTDAVDILEKFEHCGGRIALVNHPHSTRGAFEDLEYITKHFKGNVALGAHFRLDFRNGYMDDKVFEKTLALPGLNWVSLFLDVSPDSKSRHKQLDMQKVLGHTQDLDRRVIEHEKDVRITTEHAINTFLSGDQEAYNRGIQLIQSSASAGARWFNLPDTTGINDPYDDKRSITKAVNIVYDSLELRGIQDYVINIHAHNDINTAEEGIMHAFMNSPARAADLTLGGLGERNGIGDMYTIAKRLTSIRKIDYLDVEGLRHLREYSNIILGIDNPNQTVDGRYSRSVVAGTHFSAMFKDTDEGRVFNSYYNPHFDETSLGESDLGVIFTHQSSSNMCRHLLSKQGIHVDVKNPDQMRALSETYDWASEKSWREGRPIMPEQLVVRYNAYLGR